MHWTKTNFVNIFTNYEEIRKTHAETRSTSKMEPFVKIINDSHPLITFTKNSFLVVNLGSNYTSTFTEKIFEDKNVNFTFWLAIR